ncbi:MAG: hypothetical protein ACKO2P_10350 [Planctomycetota bacterium]
MTRVFLAAIGLLYVWLAAWCSFQPEETSRLVGFQLLPGSGQSEFLTVYGGLELGLALILLWPVLQASAARQGLVNCTLIHGCLVAFRGASFVLFQGIEPMTWKLAAGEWVIFLLGGAILIWSRPGKADRNMAF